MEASIARDMELNRDRGMEADRSRGMEVDFEGYNYATFGDKESVEMHRKGKIKLLGSKLDAFIFTHFHYSYIIVLIGRNENEWKLLKMYENESIQFAA